MIRTILLAATALAIAGCAAQTEQAENASQRACFAADTANGFNYIDENHISLSAGPGRRYILTTMFNARDLDWTQAIAVRSTSGWICTGNGLGVEIIGGDPVRTYPVTYIARALEPPAPQGS